MKDMLKVFTEASLLQSFLVVNDNEIIVHLEQQAFLRMLKSKCENIAKPIFVES